MTNQLFMLLAHAGETHTTTTEAAAHASQTDGIAGPIIGAVKAGAVLVLIVLLAVLFLYNNPKPKSKTTKKS